MDLLCWATCCCAPALRCLSGTTSPPNSGKGGEEHLLEREKKEQIFETRNNCRKRRGNYPRSSFASRSMADRCLSLLWKRRKLSFLDMPLLLPAGEPAAAAGGGKRELR